MSFILSRFNSSSALVVKRLLTILLLKRNYHAILKLSAISSLSAIPLAAISLRSLSLFSTGNKLSSMDMKIRQEIVHDVLELYSSHATSTSFRHYAEDAKFEDPLQYSANLSSVKSAFYSLEKIFKRSQVLEYQTDFDSEPNCIKIHLKTKYEWKLVSKETIIESTILLYLNDKQQIVRHEERWNGKEISNAETSFMGRIKEV
ncbi:unnamed protein product [Didymodactylos carnosus]|uniref:SnoaL-like domain-containing protein n=1 Tax=Didymodactylos carnosus TaxID=1234261 RepID=A0A814JTD3_9BILA|nr:unnamed protein product [Didymodactylos carnosus]CAF1040093.1 unnamed protein product [Didymodactylos carnosus]CAF3696510.1 unnamed protein product [Didymodactylos carnosus]CAF3810377.1 unnamed protein product [Didymodactylos carnosus]